jgi:hypothetical protein
MTGCAICTDPHLCKAMKHCIFGSESNAAGQTVGLASDSKPENGQGNELPSDSRPASLLPATAAPASETRCEHPIAQVGAALLDGLCPFCLQRRLRATEQERIANSAALHDMTKRCLAAEEACKTSEQRARQEALEDTARLNWMEQREDGFANIDRITSEGGRFNRLHTLREAIDAAMLANSPGSAYQAIRALAQKEKK